MTAPNTKPDEELDDLITKIMATEIDTHASWVAYAMLVGVKSNPIPITKDRYDRYKKTHAKIKKLIEPYLQAETEKAVQAELKKVRQLLEAERLITGRSFQHVNAYNQAIGDAKAIVSGRLAALEKGEQK